MTAPRAFARRLGLVLLLLATVVFATPAFESHACAPEDEGAVAMQIVDVGDAGDCADCGPACAGGCCHASHTALPDVPEPAQPAPRFARPDTWAHATAPPATRPAGPERPPRS